MFGLGFIYYVVFQFLINGWCVVFDDFLVGVICIEGSIMNILIVLVEKVVLVLKWVFEVDNVKVIVLVIDLFGGVLVEVECINFVIDEMKVKYKKLVYVVIQNVGVSVVYMIVLYVDKIYVGCYSMVGLIGVVMFIWDVYKVFVKFDVYQKVYVSGELKVMFNFFILFI